MKGVESTREGVCMCTCVCVSERKQINEGRQKRESISDSVCHSVLDRNGITPVKDQTVCYKILRTKHLSDVIMCLEMEMF
jgi:hypothetical protein